MIISGVPHTHDEICKAEQSSLFFVKKNYYKLFTFLAVKSSSLLPGAYTSYSTQLNEFLKVFQCFPFENIKTHSMTLHNTSSIHERWCWFVACKWRLSWVDENIKPKKKDDECETKFTNGNWNWWKRVFESFFMIARFFHPKLSRKLKGILFEQTQCSSLAVKRAATSHMRGTLQRLCLNTFYDFHVASSGFTSFR